MEISKLSKQQPVWDQYKQGINTKDFSSKSIARLKIIRNVSLLLFEQSFGWRFRVKGSDITDVIVGVDHDNQMVKGKQHGAFHIDVCELTTSCSERTIPRGEKRDRLNLNDNL